MRTPDDGLVHVVTWASWRAWDAGCGAILDDYQPDYYESLLALDEDAMNKRLVDSMDAWLLPQLHGRHPAQLLQRASDDVPTTCVFCVALRPYFEPEPNTDVDT